MIAESEINDIFLEYCDYVEDQGLSIIIGDKIDMLIHELYLKINNKR
jgi:hypothetical protein